MIQTKILLTTMRSVCLDGSDPKCVEVHLTGGKASSLAVLGGVPGVEVPPFFAVTTEAYQCCVLDDIGIQEAILELQRVGDDFVRIEKLSQTLRNRVEALVLPRNIEEEIENAYARLCKKVGVDNVSCAVRSSATTEDTQTASFAGQHTTALNQMGAAAICRSVKECWASAFNSRACEYRNREKIPHVRAQMAVAVQEMIAPFASGTAFSVELGTGFPGLSVAAVYGVGEGLVSGDITGDEWLFSRSTPRILIKRTLGNKATQYVFNPTSGLDLIATEAEAQRQFCLPHETASEIAAAVLAIETFYRTTNKEFEFADTEFAVTRTARDGTYHVYFLQCRPVVKMQQHIQTVDSRAVFPEDVIVSGRYGLAGATHGRVRVIERFEELQQEGAEIKEDEIVVTHKTGNYWNQYLKQLRGIVTVEGSPSSHPMLVGRERNIPCATLLVGFVFFCCCLCFVWFCESSSSNPS